MYKKVVNVDDSKRIFFVGDIHGEITKLNRKLSEIGFNKSEDILFSVGDLIDRGEDSLACLELIQEDWFHAVRGNHEELMINSVLLEDENHINCWLQNGGGWYFDLHHDDRMYAIDLAGMASKLPYVMEINHRGRKIVMCHADFPLNEYQGLIEKDQLFDVVWSRDRINNLIKNNASPEIKGADLFIFGHTPLKNPLHVQNCMWIDTGAVFGKELTVIEI